MAITTDAPMYAPTGSRALHDLGAQLLEVELAARFGAGDLFSAPSPPVVCEACGCGRAVGACWYCRP